MEIVLTNEEKTGSEVFIHFKKVRWLLLLYGFILMFSISIVYAWSVFNAPIANEFTSWSVTELSLAFTIFLITYSIMGIVSGIIIRLNKGRVWINLLISSIALFLSFFISSKANNLIALYIGFGVLGGIGVVFAYNSVLTIATKWFADIVGVITGTLLMGYGLGSFVIGKIYSWLLNSFDWRTFFLAFGIALAIISFVGIFILKEPPMDYRTPKLRKPKIDKYIIEPIECTPAQMIKRPSFWLLFGMGVFLMMASMGITNSARNIVPSVDGSLPLTEIASIVGLISIFNALGRIFTGFLNDWLGLRFNILISDTSVFIATFLIGIAIIIGNLPFLIVTFILFGFSAGMSAPDGAVVTRKFFGEKNYQINLQVVLASGILNAFGAMIMGGLFDLFGNYYIPVFILSGLAFLGFMCAFFLRKP